MGRRKVFGPALPPAMAKARRAAARAKRAPKSKAAVVSLVKDVMAREIETKYVSQIKANTSFNSEITNADIITCLPELQQMDSSNVGAAWQRNGTKISPKSLTLKCHWSLTPVARSSAIVVHYFILTSRQYKSASALSGVQMGRMLRSGGASLAQLFDGLIPSAQLPINDQDFIVLKRGSFTLQKNTGTVQDSTTAGNQPIVNPVCKSKTFRLKVPKKLTYEQDNTAPRTVLYPNGYAPFMVFGYTHQDNSTPDVVNQDVSCVARADLWFDDA